MIGVMVPSVFADTAESIIIRIDESGFSQNCRDSGCYNIFPPIIEVGDTIILSNDSLDEFHTFTSGTIDGMYENHDGVFDSQKLMPNTAFSWIATQAGEQPYYCSIHTWMTGTLIIQDKPHDVDSNQSETTSNSIPNISDRINVDSLFPTSDQIPPSISNFNELYTKMIVSDCTSKDVYVPWSGKFFEEMCEAHRIVSHSNAMTTVGKIYSPSPKEHPFPNIALVLTKWVSNSVASSNYNQIHYDYERFDVYPRAYMTNNLMGADCHILESVEYLSLPNRIDCIKENITINFYGINEDTSVPMRPVDMHSYSSNVFNILSNNYHDLYEQEISKIKYAETASPQTPTITYNSDTVNSNFDLQKKLNQYWYCLIGDYLGPNNPDCVKYDEKHTVGISPTEIASYHIEKDSTLTFVYEDSDISSKLEIFRDQSLHQDLWEIYTSITPPEILSEVVYFVVYTDDYGDEVASVNRDMDNPLKFYLSVDPVDVGPSGIKMDKQLYVSTLIHENAHILSLNENQGDNKSLSEDDASTPETYKQQMKNGEYSCAPNYYNDLAGCMKENSYLNAFYQEFWAEIYHDFKWALEFDDYETFSEHNTEFYFKYQKYWLTEYSSENPDEDFAESFMAFVLKEKPSAPTFAEQKILFFYQYPELVEMRDFIRISIATSEFCNNDNVWKDQKCRQPVPATPQQPTPQQPTPQQSENGGCLIATATYGSEMATEVQQLRELRDNQLLQTKSGTQFMTMFNDIYYSFSPIIADYERENPLFKEIVKIAITPMISSLSLMENANSESEVLGMGLSVIMLNLGMYLGVPAVVIAGIKRRF